MDKVISKKAANLYTVEYRVNYYQVLVRPEDGKLVIWIESPVWALVQPGTKAYKDISALLKAYK